jgi:uncharacterized protein YjdB
MFFKGYNNIIIKNISFSMENSPTPFKKNNKKIILLFVLAVLLIIVVAVFVNGSFKKAAVVKGVVVKQEQIVAGQPVKWTMLIPQSQVKNGKYLAQLPKNAINVKVETVSAKQAQNILSAVPKKTLSLGQRQQLAVSPTKMSTGFLASISRVLCADLCGGVNCSLADLIPVPSSTDVDVSSQATVTPNATPVLTTINITPGSASLVVGGSKQLIAATIDQNGNAMSAPADLTWSSDNTSVATVDTNGVVASVSEGTANITASSGTVTSSAPAVITVSAAGTPAASSPAPAATKNSVLTTINITPLTANLIAGGDTLQLAAATLDQNGTLMIATITWSSDNTAVATVDAKGVVTPVGAGTANITATNGVVNSTAPSVITVVAADSNYVAVTYTTPAPQVTSETTDTGLKVIVSATNEDPSAPLTDVLASTKIPHIFKVGQEDQIKIKWKNNGNQNVTFHAYDTDGDGYLDYVEWTVPHLSPEEFDFIFISKAFLLNPDFSINSDIYPQVATQDGNYVTITDGQQLRFSFYSLVDSTKTIDIYAKPTDPNSPATIQIYPVYTDSDGNQTEGPMVATVNVDHEDYYHPSMANLGSNPTDVFDFKIAGSADFDYVQDACFLAGTKVTMADGTLKNIEDVKVGDEVVSYDTVANKFITSPVEKTFTHRPGITGDDYYLKLSISGGTILNVTPNHPIYSRANSSAPWQFVNVGQLIPGDEVFGIKGVAETVLSSEKIYEREATYNLEISGDNHDYFVGDKNSAILVHNKGGVTPVQDEWEIYRNAASDPTSAYGSVDTAGTIDTNSSTIRIRVAIQATGSNGTFSNLQVEYSSDDVSFSPLGAGAAWNWASDGGGTDGAAIAGLLIPTANTKGIYIDNTSHSPSVTAGNTYEYDFEVTPTATVLASHIYYFELFSAGSAVSTYMGLPHPQINTTSVPANTNLTFTAGPSDGGSYSGAPTTVGSAVNFSATVTNTEAGNYYLAICKTSSATGTAGAPTCAGGNWCISGSTTSGAQATCNYTTANTDGGSQAWYAFACDNFSTNCSAVATGSGNNGSPFYVTPSDSYWVNGGGNWSDAANHWALASNGTATVAALPISTTNVHFDSHSGSGVVAVDGTVSIASLAVADSSIELDPNQYNVTVSGDTNVSAGNISMGYNNYSPVFTTNNMIIGSGGAIRTYGNWPSQPVQINVAGNWTNNGGAFTPLSAYTTVTFNGTSDQAINGTSATQTFFDLVVNKTGTLSVSGSTTTLTVNDQFKLSAGNFTAPATMNVGHALTLNSDTFSYGTGTINFINTPAYFDGSVNSQTFYNVTVTNVLHANNTGNTHQLTALNVHNLTIGGGYDPAVTTNISGDWNNAVGPPMGSDTVAFTAGDHRIIGSASFNNLDIHLADTMTLTSGSTVGIGGANTFNCTGTSSHTITINSTTPNSRATLAKQNVAVTCDYLALSDSLATGGATWTPGSHSTSVSNNSGWAFTNSAPNMTSISASPSPIKGGSQIVVTPTGQGNTLGDALTIYCNESGSATVASHSCGGTLSYAYPSSYSSMNCAYNVATGDATRTIYCRLYDPTSTNYSTEKTTTYVVSTSGPSISALTPVTTGSSFTKTVTVTADNSGNDTSTYQWAKVSGPGTVTFGTPSGPTSLSTTISADTAGTYVISFTAADNVGNSATSSFTLNWTGVAGACGTANGKTYSYSASDFAPYSVCLTGTASPTFPNPGNSVNWTCAGANGGSSSGTCTASVSDGGVGVTCSSDDDCNLSNYCRNGFCAVVPQGSISVASITVTDAGSVTTVVNGSTLQMSAAVLPANATNPAVTWSVTNGTGSATINSSGLFTATGAGTVTVGATAADGSGVTGAKQITVSPVPNGGGTNYYIINASAGTGGSISPTSVDIPYGSNQTFNIIPSNGYQVAGVLVDGTSVGTVVTYTFNSITASHTISATFVAITGNTSPATPINLAETQSVISYISQALNQLQQLMSSPLFVVKPTTLPPTNLQPSQPPSSQTSSTSLSNQAVVVQVMQKLLQALKSLLSIVSK